MINVLQATWIATILDPEVLDVMTMGTLRYPKDTKWIGGMLTGRIVQGEFYEAVMRDCTVRHIHPTHFFIVDSSYFKEVGLIR